MYSPAGIPDREEVNVKDDELEDPTDNTADSVKDGGKTGLGDKTAPELLFNENVSTISTLGRESTVTEKKLRTLLFSFTNGDELLTVICLQHAVSTFCTEVKPSAKLISTPRGDTVRQYTEYSVAASKLSILIAVTLSESVEAALFWLKTALLEFGMSALLRKDAQYTVPGPLNKAVIEILFFVGTKSIDRKEGGISRSLNSNESICMPDEVGALFKQFSRTQGATMKGFTEECCEVEESDSQTFSLEQGESQFTQIEATPPVPEQRSITHELSSHVNERDVLVSSIKKANISETGDTSEQEWNSISPSRVSWAPRVMPLER